jgi:hypothetical protein
LCSAGYDEGRKVFSLDDNAVRINFQNNQCWNHQLLLARWRPKTEKYCPVPSICSLAGASSSSVVVVSSAVVRRRRRRHRRRHSVVVIGIVATLRIGTIAGLIVVSSSSSSSPYRRPRDAENRYDRVWIAYIRRHVIGSGSGHHCLGRKELHPYRE